MADICDETVGSLIAMAQLKEKRQGMDDARDIAASIAKEAAYFADAWALSTSPRRLFDLAFQKGHFSDIVQHHFDAALAAGPASFIQQLETNKLDTHLVRAVEQDGRYIRHLSDNNRAHNVPLVCAAIKETPDAYGYIRMRQGRGTKRKRHGFIKNNPDVILATLSHGTDGIETILDAMRDDKRIKTRIVAEVLSEHLRS